MADELKLSDQDVMEVIAAAQRVKPDIFTAFMFVTLRALPDGEYRAFMRELYDARKGCCWCSGPTERQRRMSIGGRIALTVILSLVMFGLVAAAVAGVVVVQALLLAAGAVCIVGTCAVLVWEVTR